jgi:pseudouridine kinase
MATQEQRVLDILKAAPMLSQQAVADQLGISRNAVAGHISRLMKKGHIEGKGYVFPTGAYWVVIGGANVDCQGAAFSDIQHPDSYPGRVTDTAGGVGRNIAENIARLGLATRLISAVGQDPSGDWLLSHCQGIGIDTQAVFRLSEAPTSRYLSVVDAKGQLQVAIADMAIMDLLDGTRLAATTQLRAQAAGLVLDCNLSVSALSEIFRASSLPPVYVDCVSQAKARRLLPHLERIHTLKLNRAEAHALLGTTHSDSDIVTQLRTRGVTQVLLSLGAEGLYYGDHHGTGAVPPKKVSVVSDNGAGDALLSGFIVAESLGLQGNDRLQWAQACAAITLEYAGANHPELSIEKVSTWLNQ